MKNWSYALGAFFLRLFSHLPFSVLYFISDLLRPFVQHVVRYRLKTVRQNIAASFPDASPQEQQRIIRQFYGYFCDYMVETLKMATISPAEMKRRITFENLDLLQDLFREHRLVILFLGHYGNWEWVSSLGLWLRPEQHTAQLYKPIRNGFLDRFFLTMRSRFGGENIDKNKALRRILDIARRQEPTIIGFIADQSPKRRDIHDWVQFLHQPTAVFTGGERIAKKVNAAVCYLDVQRTSRGHYKGSFQLITTQPKEMPQWQITEDFMARFEQTILRDPGCWLWSHKRWKHQPDPASTPAS